MRGSLDKPKYLKDNNVLSVQNKLFIFYAQVTTSEFLCPYLMACTYLKSITCGPVVFFKR